MTSTATKFNRALGFSSGVLILFAVVISCLKPSAMSTDVPHTPSAPIDQSMNDSESDDRWRTWKAKELSSYDIEGQVYENPDVQLGSVAPVTGLDDQSPSRPAAILPHPFTFAESASEWLGSTEPDFALGDNKIKSGALNCGELRKIMSNPDEPFGCGIAESDQHEFALVARVPFQNSLTALQESAIKVEAYIARSTVTGESYAVPVLIGYFRHSLCDEGDMELEISKARVGSEIVFVVKQTVQDSIQATIIARGIGGLPEVVASYRVDSVSDVEGDFEITSTSNSLILATPRTSRRDGDDLNFGTIRELFPSSAGWMERLHVSFGDLDPLSKFLYNSKAYNFYDSSLTYPHPLFAYVFPSFASPLPAQCSS